MPLPKAKFNYKLTAMLITCGPVPEETFFKVEVPLLMEKHYRGCRYVMVVETSDTGYCHCHIAVGAPEGKKIVWKNTMCEDLKKICHEDDEGRAVNCMAHHVGTTCKGKTAYQHLVDYLKCPVKNKMLDPDCVEKALLSYQKEFPDVPKFAHINSVIRLVNHHIKNLNEGPKNCIFGN